MCALIHGRVPFSMYTAATVKTIPKLSAPAHVNFHKRAISLIKNSCSLGHDEHEVQSAMTVLREVL